MTDTFKDWARGASRDGARLRGAMRGLRDRLWDMQTLERKDQVDISWVIAQLDDALGMKLQRLAAHEGPRSKSDWSQYLNEIKENGLAVRLTNTDGLSREGSIHRVGIGKVEVLSLDAEGKPAMDEFRYELLAGATIIGPIPDGHPFLIGDTIVHGVAP